MSKQTTPKTENWDIYQTKILETAKFPQKERPYIIEPTPAPISIVEDGKYGKQTMYIVKSREEGNLKLNNRQFLKVCEAFQHDYTSTVTVSF